MQRLILILVLVFAVSCAKHAPQFQTQPVRQNFGPLLRDKNLDFPRSERVLTPLRPTSVNLTLESADWLDFSAELMDSGEPLLMKMGHRLIQGFYQLPQSKSTMTGLTHPPGSPYAETAKSYAQPLMAKKYEEAISHVQTKVIDVAQNMKFSVKDLGLNTPPNLLIEQVVVGLRLFEDQLLSARDGTGNSIVEKIATSVEDMYIKDLKDLEASSNFDNGSPLSTNLYRLSLSLKSLAEINDTERERLLYQVHYGYNMASREEGLENSEDALKFLVDFWLAQDLRSTYPQSLSKIFQNLSEAQLEALATENQPIIVADDWIAVRDSKNPNLLTEDKVLAQVLNNNGRVLADQDWEKLKNDQKTKLDALLISDSNLSHFADMIALREKNDIRMQRYALVVNWLGLIGRRYFPKELASIFTKLSQEDLIRLRDNSSAGLLITGHLDLSKYRFGILSSLEKGDTITQIKTQIKNSLIECVRERVSKAILPVATSLPQEITAALVPLLEKSRKDTKSFVTESFNDFGRYYFGKDIFGVQNLQKGDKKTEASDNSQIVQHPLPLYEYSQLHFQLQNGTWVQTSSNQKSSAKTLGLGLTALASRLSSFESYESGAGEFLMLRDLDFEAINKMLGVAGYRDTERELIPSLSVSMTAGLENSFIDIRAYDPSHNVFAVPDELAFSGFKLDSQSRLNPTVSVEGQMQLLKGYSRLMERYKPWEQSSFDGALGSLALEEDPSIKPFLKGDYYLLSLALASTVVQNIPVKMLSLLDSAHRYHDATQVSDLSQVDAVGAMISDYDRQGHKSKVNTSDLALAIDALSDFYEQMKEIERSDEPIILSFLQKTPADSLRASIQKLIAGFVLFTTSEMVAPDGGYYPSYDFKTMKPVTNPRNLKDQLLMERALLHAGEVLKSGYMTARAIDNFYFLNNAMWDQNLGFYRSSEGESGKSHLHLVDVVRAFSNVKKMHRALTQGSIGMGSSDPNSVIQMQTLTQLWLHRFFNSSVLNLQFEDQLQDFSL